MKKKQLKKFIGIILAISFLIFNYSPIVQGIKKYPEEIQLLEGDIQKLDFSMPFLVKIEGDNKNTLKFNGNLLNEQTVYNMKDPIAVESIQQGTTSLSFKLFGLIPIKHMKVNVHPEKTLIPGGSSIGVSLTTKGVLIVGTSEVLDNENVIHYPAMDAGIAPGDIIEQVNGIEVKNAGHLSKLVNKVKGANTELKYRRGDTYHKTHIKPILDSNSKEYKLGIWVRDSSAGVGTLTFIDPSSGKFGALGHSITDVDTGSLIPIKDGQIIESSIIDVKVGRKGKPGELVGSFSKNRLVLGDIVKNTRYGIYGSVRPNYLNTISTEPISIAYQYNIFPGDATILTTTDSGGVKEYNIKILKVNRQSKPNGKGIVIEITDPELLEKTGGILQGMSGSPIIQDNKLVGAVTHVFVNDPKKGYGIFIEWMLNEANTIMN